MNKDASSSHTLRAHKQFLTLVNEDIEVFYFFDLLCIYLEIFHIKTEVYDTNSANTYRQERVLEKNAGVCGEACCVCVICGGTVYCEGTGQKSRASREAEGREAGSD